MTAPGRSEETGPPREKGSLQKPPEEGDHFGAKMAPFLTATVTADQQTFSGLITDTMCGKVHGMVAGQPDDKCVAMCVKRTSSQYALYDGKTVLKLTDQKTPAKFAARRVKVAGTLNEKTQTIKVNSIEPEGESK